MIIEPKVRSFICTTAHPQGCAHNVESQIKYVKKQGKIEGPKKVLVIGSSTGYGLASRIVAAFGSDAKTIGVCFERNASGKRTGSAGWYNSAAFEKAAAEEGLYAKTIVGDAYSSEIKHQVIDLIKKDWEGGVDLVVYSLASPQRIDPVSGDVYKSVLKTIGEPFTNKTVNVMSGEIIDITIEPATQADIDNTVKVMGGEDWRLWMDVLADADVLAKGVKTVAYSYIGPELTFPIYYEGTIGQAKADLQKTADELNDKLAQTLEGSAFISINKALVTQASAAIPVVPLYISLLYKVMKEKNLHEGCIEQMERMFKDAIYTDAQDLWDEEGRIRLDDWEMKPEVQEAVFQLWQDVNSDNIEDISDIDGYRKAFYNLFGFKFDGVDYKADIDPSVKIPSIEE